MGSNYIAQASFEPAILLPQTFQCWDCRSAPSHTTNTVDSPVTVTTNVLFLWSASIVKSKSSGVVYSDEHLIPQLWPSISASLLASLNYNHVTVQLLAFLQSFP